MNQTNIKQWAYAHRELIFLNYDLLDTLYQSALYINQISFFSKHKSDFFLFPKKLLHYLQEKK